MLPTGTEDQHGAGEVLHDPGEETLSLQCECDTSVMACPPDTRREQTELCLLLLLPQNCFSNLNGGLYQNTLGGNPVNPALHTCYPLGVQVLLCYNKVDQILCDPLLLICAILDSESRN